MIIQFFFFFDGFTVLEKLPGYLVAFSAVTAKHRALRMVQY